ncbi:FUSC family protein [Thiotrichales bacterium 19S3-7]|nr:FUSC family protein [Thiotrichales bacterium 19S3-7]MCF6802980.1 FUSC family protein [Thiotrichales bacterium 19S3-11]
MKSIIQFNKLLQLSSILIPGVIIALISHQPYWILATFYAICSIIPYTEHQNLKFALLMLTGLFISSEILSYLIVQVPLLFIIILVLISCLISIIEKNKPSYRPISAYLFIGLIYSSFEINHYFVHRSYSVIILIFILSVVSLFIGIFFEDNHKQPLDVLLNFNLKQLYDYTAYPIVLMITLFLWYQFDIPQPQWFIWSALTVTNLNINQIHQKFINRLTGALIGLPLGIISILMIQLLASNYLNLMQLIHYVSFMGIILSLRIFKDYIYGFAARCYFVSIFAGDYFIYASISRISDVFIGGLIGYGISYCLNKLKLLQNNIH